MENIYIYFKTKPYTTQKFQIKKKKIIHNCNCQQYR